MGPGMDSMERTVTQDVSAGRYNRVLVVPELPEPVIAVATQQAANLPGGVTVVNHEYRYTASPHGRRRSLADRAFAILFGEYPVVVRESDPVLLPEISGSLFQFLVFQQMRMKNTFHIGNERIFGAAGPVRSSIANLDMSMHGAKVVERSAVPAGTQLPCARPEFYFFKTGDNPVFIESPPVVLSVLCTFFALMRLAVRVACRNRKIFHSCQRY